MNTCPPQLCHSNDDNWISCDVCDQWFHQKCVLLTPDEVETLLSFHCRKCDPVHGPLVSARKSKRARTNIDYRALDLGERFAVEKLWHPHIARLLSFEDQVDDPYEIHYNGDVRRTDRPTLIKNGQAHAKELGMELPKEFTIDSITRLVGEDTPVEVMDVLTQQGLPGWKMAQWRDYYKNKQKDRIRNVISLEISDSSIGREFRRPKIVRDSDLVDRVWPHKDRPKITTYCLMSVKDSFTDFHIDFGGTLVYYTVFTGGKTFLFYPPTEENLVCYSNWCMETDQNYIWFGDYTTRHKRKTIRPQGGFKVSLSPGDVFLIPLGWIHAVYTPNDSLVIGGNYITAEDLEKQFRINQVEKETKVPAKYRFPKFNQVIWWASWWYWNHDRSDLSLHQWELLIRHHRNHKELATTLDVARRAIPSVIGEDYVDTVQSWVTKMREVEVESKLDV